MLELDLTGKMYAHEMKPLESKDKGLTEQEVVSQAKDKLMTIATNHLIKEYGLTEDECLGYGRYLNILIQESYMEAILTGNYKDIKDDVDYFMEELSKLTKKDSE